MRSVTMVVALYAGTLVGCTTTKPPPPPALAPPAAQSPSTVLSGQLGDQTLVATATVLRIDRKTRHVTLKRPDGTKFTIVAGPEVRNLPQVQKGDVVRITYRESIAYDVKKPGSTGPGITASSDVSRAPEGEKPAGSATDTVTVRMTIAAIDKATSEATLRGPRGDVVVVKAKDPTKLDMVSVGDVVEITYTEALAVRVEKAGTL